MMDFKFGEHVRILLIGENHKEVLYGELENIVQRGPNAFDDSDRGTKIMAEVNFLSIQKEISEDKEITEAILKHNLKVENIKLYDEICKKKKELKELQETFERLEKQCKDKSQRIFELTDCMQKCKTLLL